MTWHYKNISLENIVEIIDGIEYVEEWKAISGYNGAYVASSMGRIKTTGNRYNGNKEQILSLRLDKDGYVIVNLYNKDGMKTKKVHRIVCDCFHENPENKKEVNHKKGIKTDNRSSQVEWATQSENMKHKHNVLMYPPPIKAFRVGDNIGSLNHKSIKIKCDTLDMLFNCISEAEKVIGVKREVISEIIKSKRVHFNGLVFSYA